MKKEKLLVLFFMFMLSPAFAQVDCKKCDIDKVATADQNITTLSKKILTEFLCTFDSICENNIEYSQWSNEVLYKVIEENPELFFSVLIENKAISINALIEELQGPLLDYEFQEIYDKVHAAKAPQNLKTKFLSAIETAAESDGQKIKKR